MFVIGPSGSGKSTLCDGFDQFFTSIKRKYAIINLDPANDNIKYNCAFDISTLIQLDEVQKELNLGPNGGLMYCLDFLAQNLHWLQEKIMGNFPHPKNSRAQGLLPYIRPARTIGIILELGLPTANPPRDNGYGRSETKPCGM